MRENTSAVGDSSITEDQANIEVELANGKTISRFVAASLGNLSRPMTDRQLDDKFRDQAVLSLPAGQVEKLIELCWKIDDLEDISELVNVAVPATPGR